MRALIFLHVDRFQSLKARRVEPACYCRHLHTSFVQIGYNGAEIRCYSRPLSTSLYESSHPPSCRPILVIESKTGGTDLSVWSL